LHEKIFLEMTYGVSKWNRWIIERTELGIKTQ
jgi:hypothetical protein